MFTGKSFTGSMTKGTLFKRTSPLAGLGFRMGPVLRLLLALTPALAVADCSASIGNNNCYEIVAIDITTVGGVTTGGVEVEVLNENCPLMTGFSFVSYNDQDGKPGYDPSGGDIEVESFGATTTEPSSKLSVGSFSSQSSDGGVNANKWQATITDASGGTHTFSGKF